MVPRGPYLNTLDRLCNKRIIKVLTGIRRCDRSTILQLYQGRLLKSGVNTNQIQTLNFEDLDLVLIKTYLDLYNYINGHLVPNKVNYIFIDEIQSIPNFEKALDGLYIRNNVDLYVTGPNALMLSGELAALLSGRYIEIPICPFSFRESLQTTELSKKEALSTYLERGGFPFATELNDNNTYPSYIQGIINTVLVKDILAKVDRGDTTLLEAIASFLTEADGSLVTPARIANTLTSNGIGTGNAAVISYLEKLVNSYLFYQYNRYDIAGKKYLQIDNKYCPVDPALRCALLDQKRPNIGNRLEDIVFIELRRCGYEVYVGSLENKEIDFVAIKDGIKQYYQISLTVRDDKTYSRGITPFPEITDNYRKVLLTQGPGSYNGNGIEQTNVVD